MPYKDPAAHAARAKRRAQRARERQRSVEVIVAAKSVPCADCGGLFHYACMDFDHVRGEKKCDISKMKGGYSLRALREEIEKCEVVCANCHRLRTFSRLRGAAVEA